MRKILIAVVALSVSACSAETIVLKNGRSIIADSVHEENGKVEYEIGDNVYRIPKSLVEKIESSAPPPAGSNLGETPAAARPQNLTENPNEGYAKPLPPSAVSASASSQELRVPSNDLSLKVVHDGRVDLDILNQLSAAGNTNSAAAGYFMAGQFEYQHGNRDTATRYFERALGYAPDNAAILDHYAALLIQTGRGREAINYAEHAVQTAPTSPEAFSILGYAYFTADRSRAAIAPWEKSLSLHPDEKLQALLEKTKRELNAEADFTERDTGRFTLRYEGSATKDSFREQIVGALDKDYNELTADLGIEPRQNIPVILYTEQAFFDVTQAPTWTGALNDGKLRIPVRGLDYITPELARVLKHELTHSFVNQVSAGRCPQWLNEGIAQMEEGRTLDARGPRLAGLFKNGSQISFNGLEGSFLKFSNNEALVAYDESLAAALYIRDTYGIGDLRRLLERVSEGGTSEEAMKEVLHLDYSRLETEVGQYLATKYPS